MIILVIRHSGFERLLRQMDKEEQIAILRGILEDNADVSILEKKKDKLVLERNHYAELARESIDVNARVAQDQAAFNERYRELAGEHDRLQAEVKKLEAEIQSHLRIARRIEAMIAALETAGEEFTVELWRGMVERVTVFQDKRVFTLANGREMRV